MGKAETVVMLAIQTEASKMGHRLFRNNVGAYELKHGGWLYYGVGGENWPDLIGFYQPGCKFFVCEAKAPGEEPTEDQYIVLNSLSRQGAVAIWADSVEMFRRKLKDRG